MLKEMNKLPVEELANLEVIDPAKIVFKNKSYNSARFEHEVLKPYCLWWANIEVNSELQSFEEITETELMFAQVLASSNCAYNSKRVRKLRSHLIGEIVSTIVFKNKKIIVPELYSKKTTTLLPGTKEFECLFQELLHESDLNLKKYYWHDFKSLVDIIDKAMKKDNQAALAVIEYWFSTSKWAWLKLPKQIRQWLKENQQNLMEGEKPNIKELEKLEIPEKAGKQEKQGE